jgi:ABC-type nitrate/sulfonate/bicarbonate transport system permease component
VYLPGCLPQIFTGLRLAAGRALIMTISVEMVNPTNGAGAMIFTAWQTFATDKLYCTIAATAATGAVLHYSLQRIERRLIPWKT